MVSHSNKPKRVSLTRDFPHGCGTHSIQIQTSETRQESIGVANFDYHRRPDDRLNEVESIDVIMKKAGFNVTANTDVGKGRFVSSFSKFAPSCGSKVKPLSSEEAISLIASQSRRRQVSGSSTSIQRELSLAKAVENYKNTSRRSHATTVRAKTYKPSQNRDARRSHERGLVSVIRQNKISKLLSPREKVQKAVRLFKLVFKELNRGKADGESRTATNKIHYVTRAILMSEGIQVNAQKRIGPVPGIKVGDEFQYKSELNLIGLHFDIRGGIDYINRGGLKLATSIISSEGNGYVDRFNSDVIIYSGQGGNLRIKDQKVVKDQKLEMGNLALANSMEKKTPVRVIRGEKRVDQRGKRYVYDGLYLVQEYWQERGRRGNVLFKFKLCRVPRDFLLTCSYY